MEAVALLIGGPCALLVRARGDQGGVHVDDQPVLQRLPGDLRPGEPARPRGDQLPHVSPGTAPGLRDPAQRAGIGQLQRPPHGRVAGRGPQRRPELGKHLDVAHAGRAQRDRGRHRHQRHPPVHLRGLPPPRERRPQARGQPGPVGQQAQQHRTGVPGQAGPSAVTFRPWSHPVCCMTRSAPDPGNYVCVVTS